ISSSKFPVEIRVAKDLLYKGAGFDLIAVSRDWFTIRLRTAGLSNVKPFASSAGNSSLGTMSKSNTSKPILAKWQAIREPITPDPNTATFLIFLFISRIFSNFLWFNLYYWGVVCGYFIYFL